MSGTRVKRPILLLLMIVAGACAVAQEQQLRLSELLFNPHPGGADYVEIHNPGPLPVSLRHVRLAQWKNDAIYRLYLIDTSRTMAPGEYLVVTTDAADILSHYNVRHSDWLLEVGSLPAYNDASGTLLLTLSDSSVLERFDYNESMHNRLISDPEGVSLERRSFTRDANSGGNWQSAASTVGYGTPTAPNSQSTEFLFLDDQFQLSDNILTPDGDGDRDLLDITYQLASDDLSANIDIYDGSGRLVRHLLRGALLGTQGVVSWDGSNDVGARCRRGNYIIRIEAYNPAGQKQVGKHIVALMIR